jgi:diadenosine tetraphosphate (Ap4A) HIT family hydrolase
MKNVENCLACDTLSGKIVPPGGVIYADEYWQVDHALPPIWVPGLLVIKLRRHCEHLAELSPAEAAAFGPFIQQISRVLQEVTKAQKIHVASYGEGIRHMHFLVTPRTAEMPASHIQLTFWLLWRRSLYRLG